MVTNVFGKPVTDGNRIERATEALNDPNADGKRDEAVAYVRKLQKNWCTGVSTLGIFYNATGETLYFCQEYSWYGKVHGFYPSEVENGQWGAFLHDKTHGAASGSAGFVLYRVKVDETGICNQLISWLTASSGVNNLVYCDIFDEDVIEAPTEVDVKRAVLDSRHHSVKKKGMLTTAKIDEGTYPFYEVEFTREDVAAKRNLQTNIK